MLKLSKLLKMFLKNVKNIKGVVLEKAWRLASTVPLSSSDPIKNQPYLSLWTLDCDSDERENPIGRRHGAQSAAEANQ